jgi:hypothetical protein
MASNNNASVSDKRRGVRLVSLVAVIGMIAFTIVAYIYEQKKHAAMGGAEVTIASGLAEAAKIKAAKEKQESGAEKSSDAAPAVAAPAGDAAPAAGQ